MSQHTPPLTFPTLLARSWALFETGEEVCRDGQPFDLTGYTKSDRASYWLGYRSALLYRPTVVPCATAADRGSEGSGYRGRGLAQGSLVRLNRKFCVGVGCGARIPGGDGTPDVCDECYRGSRPSPGER